MPFKPGQIANPYGRPHKTEQQKRFEQKCREWSDLYAFNRLRTWTEHENPKVAVWALGEILNRGFGKSVETSVIEAHVTDNTGKTVEEFAGEIALVVSGAKAEGAGDSLQIAVDDPK